ncbi:MAG: FecR domain-containing protein [Candidatus Woesearchaeota archaeon]
MAKKNDPKESSNSRSSKLNLKIMIPVAAVLLLAGVSLFFLLGSNTRVAFLNIEEGTVEVDTGKGWAPANDGMDLSLEDKVRTLSGKAVLVLYESIIVQLDADTEVMIEELSKKNVKLYQNSGSTWNKFASIVGIHSFEVETPTTVATVRGTEFWDDMKSVGVVAGKVDVKWGDKEFNLQGGEKVVLDEDDEPVKMRFDAADIERALSKKQAIIDAMKNLRQAEIEKHGVAYSTIKKTYGWSDADVHDRLEKLDNGKYDVQAIKAKAKIPAVSVDRFVKLSEEIAKNMKEMEMMRAKLQGSDGSGPAV